jgi:hypothetical protein
MPSLHAHEKRKQNQWYREETPCAHDTLCCAMHSQPLKKNVYESSIDAAEFAEKMLL